MPLPQINEHIRISNDVDELQKLTTFIEEISEKVGLDDMQAMNLNLAMEEAVTNVVLYAYGEDEKGDIDIDCLCEENEMTFVITDKGKPFDPTQASDPDITLSAEERGIGGLGIFLVRKLMDSMTYERKNNCNVLSLKKRFE